ncbi:hypothetical protein ONZ51_g5687 [Trametes cubensis]|uniref:C2H2-type domain-containing protein n=1 Tax=Trametes cubensis TaxID=1111947 RepID=A0AAD7XDE1_9APHY|nr:hypothetical protein ONZ51_g5687 [Trametes cubensis]
MYTYEPDVPFNFNTGRPMESISLLDELSAEGIRPLSDWVSVPGDDSFNATTGRSPSPFKGHQFTLNIDFYTLVDPPRLKSPPVIEPPAKEAQQHSLVQICKGGTYSEDGEDPEDAPPPAKCRRRQDTTPRFECDKCNSRFARSHNLKVHVKSVHENQRSFPCKVPGCEHAFSRKHDLARHFQSKHTDKGSPRRKGNKE